MIGFRVVALVAAVVLAVAGCSESHPRADMVDHFADQMTKPEVAIDHLGMCADRAMYGEWRVYRAFRVAFEASWGPYPRRLERAVFDEVMSRCP